LVTKTPRLGLQRWRGAEKRQTLRQKNRQRIEIDERQTEKQKDRQTETERQIDIQEMVDR
jgi:hypothetical protein